MSYVETYTTEYGPQTIVFIQVGSFYEIYDDGSNFIDIKGIAELLNILVSKRNKNIPEVSRTNVLMAGIPTWAKQKYFNILVANNYTVVLVEQVTEPPNPQRKVTEILSPGVPMDGGGVPQTGNAPSNFLSTIYIEEDTFLSVGFSAIDVFTGKSFVYECNSSKIIDSSYCYDELYRLVSSYSPKELVIFGNKCNKTFKEIKEFLDHKSCKFHDKLNTFDESLLKISYIEHMLKKVYPNTGMLSCIEYLDLEKKPTALAAFVYLINFTYNHNDSILNRIQKPRILETHGCLHLSYNCAKKLDVLQPGYGLLALLNTCATAMGRRLFRDRLLNPITNSEILQRTYDSIEGLIEADNLQKQYGNLKEIYDLEQIYRRICNRRLQQFEWMNIHTSIVNSLKLNPNHELSERIKAFQSVYQDTIDLSTCEIPDRSPFKKGVDLEIDDIQEKLESNIAFFEKALPNDFFKLETNERDGHYITITQKRFTEFKKTLNSSSSHYLIMKEVIAKPISSTSAIVKLYHPKFDEANKEIICLRLKLKTAVNSKYQQFLQKIAEDYQELFSDLVDFISHTDVLVTHARNAVRFGYTKPIITGGAGKSHIDIKGVRHPLIERLIDTPYVANDISLGVDKDGMLLYGTNATGKSSLGKSVALAILMAQSGMYVSAESMKFTPYTRMFARIPTGDDLQRGHSTFVVEMLELRNILQFANESSFCISDELCNGTESISGVGIVAAVIETLCQKRCSFITASHLHEIVDIPEIIKIPNLRVCHLEVRYDANLNALVYDRKLKEGSGSSIYGLEVCRSLSLPEAFLERANQIRKDILHIDNKVLKNKSSKYNSQVYFDVCELCGDPSQEIHHIKEQHKADKNGLIEGVTRKNDVSNLMNVCSSCHDQIHSGNIQVQGYVQTSEGRKISTVSASAASADTALKSQIHSLMKEKHSIINILRAIQEDHPDISKYRIQKVIKEIKSSIF